MPFRAAGTPVRRVVPRRTPNARAVPDLPGAARRVGRPDLALLPGRWLRDPGVRAVCDAYGLRPLSGRTWCSYEAGVQLDSDVHGLVGTVLLHFGADGFTPYHGELPAGAGAIPRRAPLWSALGRPEVCDVAADEWHLRDVTVRAAYARDGERVEVLTLALPRRLPRAA